MPRHRIEREPRHRAQRPTRERAPRVQFRAATARPAGHRRPATGPARFTIRWPGIGTGASDRIVALRTRMRPYRRRLMRGAVRGLVVSPWFAAGAGFVVAAGAYILAPHAELSFGGAIGVTHCKVAKCHHPISEAGGAAPVPAGGPAGIMTPSPSPTPSSDPTAGLAFRYTVLWQARGEFEMVLTVTGKKDIGPWKLSFVIPGATHVSVLGADWQQSGPNGGTVTGTTSGGGADITDGHSAPITDEPTPSESAYLDSRQQNGVYFFVEGDGTARAPDPCSFNDAQCVFTLATSR